MTFTTFDVITRRSSAALISGYQKHISPRKGFSCAYRVLHGGESCSAYVKRAILEQGLLEAIQASRQRFQACKAANQLLKARIQAISSSNETQEEETDKQQRRRTNETSQCNDGVNCADAGCQSLECMAVEWPESGVCDSGMDCGAPDCSGLDCCSGADCCSCGG